MKKILVMNGPNLNLIGLREKTYGAVTLDAINKRLEQEAKELGVEIEFFQSNHEGEMIDRLHAAMDKVDGVILNGGGYAHTSVALRDTIAATALTVIEVHISNVHTREEFRHFSYVTGVAKGCISGLGWKGYLMALKWFATDDAL